MLRQVRLSIFAGLVLAVISMFVQEDLKRP